MDETSQWRGDWEADATAKRAAWASTDPTQRWIWMLDMLEFADRSGALARDRGQRARAARELWARSDDHGRG
ncbi:hypothetical protein BH23ACT9_BH23ACT9_09610 [soil metagenome]